MKKSKLKQWGKDLIFATVIALIMFEGLSLIAWSAKNYDKQMIEQEIQKKTEMSSTQISQ